MNDAHAAAEQAQLAAAADSLAPTAACQVPSAATPPHHTGRRHTGILPGPTRGYQPRTWGKLFELLVQRESIAITAEQQLRLHDAEEFADRMVLRTETILEAFNWLVQHGLVAIRKTADGHLASPDLAALATLLRKQQELARAGAQGPAIAALSYFRGRNAMVAPPWLEPALGKEDGNDFERVACGCAGSVAFRSGEKTRQP